MINTGRDTYAIVWKIFEKDGKYSGNIGTSQRNKKDGGWDNSSWNVRFVTEAAKKIVNTPERSKIVIKPGNCQIENKYVGEKTYTNVIVYDFDIVEKKAEQKNSDELPF